jgi:hypothetical protein
MKCQRVGRRLTHVGAQLMIQGRFREEITRTPDRVSKELVGEAKRQHCQGHTTFQLDGRASRNSSKLDLSHQFGSYFSP